MIISEEKILDCLFNYPENLQELFEEKSLDYFTITDCLDDIHKKTKGHKQTAEDRLINTIFGKNDDVSNSNKKLINCFMENFEDMRKIENIEELKKEMELFHLCFFFWFC